MENKNENILEISKELNVSREELFKAWTETEQLKKWWRPENLQLESVENDINPQGKVKYIFKTTEGKDLTVEGEYKEAIKNERLVYTWNWEIPEASTEDGHFTLTILFKENNGKSILDVKQEPFSTHESVAIHQKAWETSLQELAAYLENSKSSNSSSGNSVHDDKNTAGNRELEEQSKVGGYS
ncbi:MAG: SRPBCC domain-containing protein [Opitutaceae bacterium]|nr:SRPBCC domain-containing protein [Cytophagales bacterium]